jgi:hypothetical protein
MCFPPISSRFLVLATAVLLAGCDKHGIDFIVAPEFDDAFSFESGLGDWTGKSRDVTGDTWGVVQSPDQGFQGTKAARLTLDNVNGQGKVWIEKRYAVEKNQLYQVSVTFVFGTKDLTTADQWQVVYGAALDSPAAVGTPTPRSNASNGQSTDASYKFSRPSLTFDLMSDADGELFVYMGVWGTSPGQRTYYVDDVTVVLTRKGLSPKL